MLAKPSRPLRPISAELYQLVFDALQPAEEIDGPEGQDYLDLMLALKDEIESRIAAFEAINPNVSV